MSPSRKICPKKLIGVALAGALVGALAALLGTVLSVDSEPPTAVARGAPPQRTAAPNCRLSGNTRLRAGPIGVDLRHSGPATRRCDPKRQPVVANDRRRCGEP